MRIISRKALREHWESPNRGDSEEPLKAWFAITKKAGWKNFAEIKQQFGTASAVGTRVVFNIAGNKYRLVVRINYELQIALVRFVGTHKEYDELDVKNA
jgi:mRNA interferase HigB